MSVYQRGESKIWWFKFNWRGETIRESTKQTNRRVAVQMEAARKTTLAKGEVGIRDRKPTPTVREFAKADFLPFVESTFREKLNTLRYYRGGAKALSAFDRIGGVRLDEITGENIAAFVGARQAAGLKTSSLNRELQVLRRMFQLAMEWEKTTKVLPKVRMIPGEAHRDRVLTPAEESAYLKACVSIGQGIETAYSAALQGIRATLRSETPIKPQDPYRLRDAATILLDCGLRPEECFRLRWENILDDCIEIRHGKTDNARRRIPMSPRVLAIVEMRRGSIQSEWVFPAPTKSGHIEPSSLKKPHPKACTMSSVEQFELYTFRHTCITRWAASGMDPWTIAYLAGHRDMSITRRYVHPQVDTIREAMERARKAAAVQTGHTSGHSGEMQVRETTGNTDVIQ